MDRPISFLSASIVFKSKVVGMCVRAIGAISVERPQDNAFLGEGKIKTVNGMVVRGLGTFFTRLTVGCTLKLSNKDELFVAEVVSDEEIITTTYVRGFEN